MKEGFIFDSNKCVACNACCAGCILENGCDVQPRMIYTYNPEALPHLPLLNISSACNHCEKAVCLDGCPAGSYFREPITGAVIIDEKKCMGCKYCQWNCPYDSPKLSKRNRTIGKCNLCYIRLIEGFRPACTSSCPTGALKFGELRDPIPQNFPSFFPDRNLNPSLFFSAKQNDIPLKIIPGKNFEEKIPALEETNKRIDSEFSLIIFSFLITLSVSIQTSSLIKGLFPQELLILALIVSAGFISLFHLGKPFVAWRALTNLRSSPLSREIFALLVYSALSTATAILQLPVLLIVSAVSGLILLELIDLVYIYADKRKSIILHSGQALLSALLIISFLAGIIVPFIFVAIIKVAVSIINLRIHINDSKIFGIRFFRIALLIIAGTSYISGTPCSDPVLILLILTGEFIDRINFYYDFNPVNIKSLTYNRIKASQNEKKRC